ncbi:high choriolytic enzyme 1-like isoform X1 [Denticeps clupeoides]|uniref:high choriolytic enzyme 1-like isoform X1 n=1 Tax=Denticeps clupeoides TaxID=299321 RepID=UPI0010A3D77A|nr:high choriolytic enzyme 1-like isoform X1 [Denticeps clupeoides]
MSAFARTFLVLLSTLTSAQCHYQKSRCFIIEKSGENYTMIGNGPEKDDCTAGKLIEEANKNLGLNEGDPLILFGDVAVGTGFQNADPCTSRNCLWPKANDGNVHIPYVISNQYSSGERSIIERALQAFHASTCIRFHRRQSDMHYLDIRSLQGCWSFVGRRTGSQTVSLSRQGCVYPHVVQHEILHALGFNHEQCRSDRDEHVRIIYSNVAPGQEHNFRKVQTNNLGTPYDYDSVMHYPRNAFSRNGQPTILPIPNRDVSIGRATVMSRNDILRINRLYRCQ